MFQDFVNVVDNVLSEGQSKNWRDINEQVPFIRSSVDSNTKRQNISLIDMFYHNIVNIPTNESH